MAWWKECFESPEEASRFIEEYNELTKEYEKKLTSGHSKKKENPDYDEVKRKLARFIGTDGVKFLEIKLKCGDGLVAEELRVLAEGHIPDTEEPELEER